MASFVTLEEYESATGVETPVGQVTVVEWALDAACAAIRNYTDQDFDLVTDDVVMFDGNGQTGLVLPQLPVLDVTQVTIDATPITDYVLQNAGILRRTRLQPSSWWGLWSWMPPPTWPFGWQNIEVTYSHGYAEIPADLKNVAVTAARTSLTALSHPMGVTLEAAGPFQIRYDKTDITINLKPFAEALDFYTNQTVLVA